VTFAQTQHSALHPASASAESVLRLFDFFVIVSIIVYVAVMAALLYAAFRRRSVDEREDDPRRTGRAHRGVIAATSVTVAILFVSLVYDVALGGSLTRTRNAELLSVRVTGHQWWWEVEYEDPIPQNRVRTANEIHVPVGRPVALKLESHDVIHSFWAPNLNGKKDLIPGKHNELRFQPRQTGTFRVQCAEFCGLQHANMSLYVVVQSESEFRAWLDRERRPALKPAPTDTLTNRGQLVFESGSCATCHAISGTTAQGTIGPDLTHLASRHSIAAGTLAPTRANLAGWIVDPQRIKPGVLMPSNGLEPADLHALLAYLGSLR